MKKERNYSAKKKNKVAVDSRLKNNRKRLGSITMVSALIFSLGFGFNAVGNIGNGIYFGVTGVSVSDFGRPAEVFRTNDLRQRATYLNDLEELRLAIVELGEYDVDKKIGKQTLQVPNREGETVDRAWFYICKEGEEGLIRVTVAYFSNGNFDITGGIFGEEERINQMTNPRWLEKTLQEKIDFLTGYFSDSSFDGAGNLEVPVLAPVGERTFFSKSEVETVFQGLGEIEVFPQSRVLQVWESDDKFMWFHYEDGTEGIVSVTLFGEINDEGHREKSYPYLPGREKTLSELVDIWKREPRIVYISTESEDPVNQILQKNEFSKTDVQEVFGELGEFEDWPDLQILELWQSDEKILWFHYEDGTERINSVTFLGGRNDEGERMKTYLYLPREKTLGEIVDFWNAAPEVSQISSETETPVNEILQKDEFSKTDVREVFGELGELQDWPGSRILELWQSDEKILWFHYEDGTERINSVTFLGGRNDEGERMKTYLYLPDREVTLGEIVDFWNAAPEVSQISSETETRVNRTERRTVFSMSDVRAAFADLGEIEVFPQSRVLQIWETDDKFMWFHYEDGTEEIVSVTLFGEINDEGHRKKRYLYLPGRKKTLSKLVRIWNRTPGIVYRSTESEDPVNQILQRNEFSKTDVREVFGELGELQDWSDFQILELWKSDEKILWFHYEEGAEHISSVTFRGGRNDEGETIETFLYLPDQKATLGEIVDFWNAAPEVN